MRVLIKRDTTSNTPNIKLLSSRKGFRDRSRFPTLPSALTYTILVLRSVKVGLLEYCCRVVESSTTNGHVERNWTLPIEETRTRKPRASLAY